MTEQVHSLAWDPRLYKTEMETELRVLTYCSLLLAADVMWANSLRHLQPWHPDTEGLEHGIGSKINPFSHKFLLSLYFTTTTEKETNRIGCGVVQTVFLAVSNALNSCCRRWEGQTKKPSGFLWSILYKGFCRLKAISARTLAWWSSPWLAYITALQKRGEEGTKRRGTSSNDSVSRSQ